MTSAPVIHSLDARGVATVALNRPEVGNAYNGDLIQGLLARHGRALGRRPSCASCCSGATASTSRPAPTWPGSGRSAAPRPRRTSRVSRATAEAVDRLNRLPVPTVALVQGGCFGGGTGIVAACDVVIAADNAMFSIAEVRWGLTAAIIIPQLSDAISVRQLRRYALTGERFGAAEAQRIGLAHQVVPLDRLAAAGEEMVARLLENGPVAMAETKALALAERLGRLRPRRPSTRSSRATPPSARRRKRPRASPRSPRSARRDGRAANPATLGQEMNATALRWDGARRSAPLTFAAMRT